MGEIKFRLIERGEAVGYERWNGIAGKWCYDTKFYGSFSIHNSFIPHTDKEQFSGEFDTRGIPIFVGDKVKWHTWDGYWADTDVKLESGRFYPVATGCLEYSRFDKKRGFTVTGSIRDKLVFGSKLGSTK